MKNGNPKNYSKILVTILIVAAFAIPSDVLNGAIFEPGFESEVVATGLTLPTAMAFAADGRVFITEKGGAVRLVKDGALLPTPVITISDLNTYGDRGLLGIATDPDFMTNGYLYLSYTYENTPGLNFTGEKTGRIVRVTVVGDVANESTKVVLVGTVGGNAASPSCENFAVTADCIPSDSPSHSVGGLRFGPDGKLYATLGEAANFDYADPKSLRAQNIDSLAGKVIRINKDGTAPSDNPFFDGNTSSNRSKVYALGLRNAFRLNFNPHNGSLFLGDVGWSAWEEINRVTPGANFGWPCLEGDFPTSHNCTPSSTPVNPAYAYAHDASFAGAVVMGAYGANNAYPAIYNSSLFIGDYAQNWIKRVVFDENNEFVSVHDFMSDPNGPVDISTGPDGNIYYLAIYTGDLVRITHTSGNRKPVPVVSATPTAGLLPLSVSFSSTGSNDPDGDALTYSWNFGDGATSNAQNPTHEYTTAGTYSASLTLTDIHGASAAKSISITAGNQSPQAFITSPANGTLYVPFQTIQLSGDATDFEDGTLPASAFHWEVILHHNTHIHHIEEFNNTKNPSFIAPDHNASDVYTEIKLMVTDSTGLVSTQSINLFLNNGVSAGNMIQNPSVEAEAGAIPARPVGWERGGWGTNNRVFSYPVPGFEGNKAVRVEISSFTDGDAKWYFLPVNVIPGETYHYSGYYTSTATTYLSAQFGFPNGTFQYQPVAVVPPAATPTLIEGAVTIPAGVQTLSVFHQLESAGILVTDNFSLELEDAGTTTAQNLIINGSFESTNGANPAGWTPVVTPGTTAQFNYPITGVDGGKAVGINITAIGPDGNARWQFDEIPVQTGVEYTYEEYYKASTIHDIIGRYTFTDGSEHFFGLKKEIPAATDWTFLTGKFVAPENIASITLMSQISTNATFELDNVRMFESGTGTPSEIIPPVANFTNPLAGQTISGTVNLTATASDNVGVAGWFFAVDGTPLHLEQSGEPVALSWDSTTVANGSHALKITVRDAVGNNNREIITVNVNNVAATSSGAILNPSLEVVGSTGNPTNWFTGGWGTNNRTFTFPVAGSHGANAAKVEITSYTNGDAKWFFTDVPVAAGNDYTITHDYKASVPTQVFARYTMSDGSMQYAFLGSVPLSLNWASTTNTITPPTNVVSVTLFHVLTSAGVLEIDNYNLAGDTPPPPPPATNLVQNPSLETAGAGGDPANWLRGGWGTNNRTFTYPTPGVHGVDAAKVEITAYTNGDAKWYFTDVPVTPGTAYTFSHQYKSTASTQVLARYTLTGGATQYAFMGTLPASATWATSNFSLTAPANAASVTVFHVVHSVGALEIDNFSLTGPGSTADTTAPTVSVTAPSAGATISGTVSVTTNAADNVGVAGVSLLVDGGVVGAEDTTAPYSFSLDTTTLSNGAHTVSARARDAANNTADAAEISVTISNVAPPSSNLIANPSFENVNGSGDPVNWTKGGWGTNNRVYTVGVGADGGKSAKIDITSYINGDAKWIFDNVSVTPGNTYTFANKYRSNVSTNVTIRYTMSDGTQQYVGVANPVASANWSDSSFSVTPPSGAVSMTIMHIIYQVGTLEVDEYTFVDGNPNTFNNGMVSLTFDDGWYTQYSTALPMLNAENIKGSFYIISQFTADGEPDEQVVNPSLEILGANSDPENWFRGGWGTNDRTHTVITDGAAEGSRAVRVEITNYTSGDAKWYFGDTFIGPTEDYVFSDRYNSTVPSTVMLRYTFLDGSVSYSMIDQLPSTGGTWQTYQKTIVTPANVSSVTAFHLINEVGVLTTDAYSFKLVPNYMSPAQMLEIQAAGHEIGSHTRTHADLTTLDTTGKQGEITGSRSDLVGMGANIDTFVYPYGAYNAEVKQITQSTGYIGARSVDRGFNVKNSDKFALKIQAVFRDTTMTEIQNWVAQAEAEKMWLILMFHQIDNNPADTFGNSPAMLQQILDHIQSSGIEVVTMKQGLQLMDGGSAPVPPFPTGSLSVALDANSPVHKIVSGGSTGVELARIQYSASNIEDIDVRQVALQLSDVGLNSPNDLVGQQVSLWTTSGVQVGVAAFAGDTAVSSSISGSAFRVVKNTSRTLIVRGDIANICAACVNTVSGSLLKVDYDGDNEGVAGNFGVGVSSGANIIPSANDTVSAGVRIMAAYPVFETVAFTPPTLTNGTNKSLYRFKVTAVDGEIALYKFTFNVADPDTSTDVSNFKLFAFTNSTFDNADTTFSGNGVLNVDPAIIEAGPTGTADANVYFQSTSGTNRIYVISDSQSRYFELRGDITNVESGPGVENMVVKLQSDPSFVGMLDAAGVDSNSEDDFIWSPVSTTSQVIPGNFFPVQISVTLTPNDIDFTNGYRIVGLPAGGMAATTHTSAN